MKKENVFKRIMRLSSLGISMGISILMIGYALIFLLEGEDVFKAEISQLQNFDTLVWQLFLVAIAYYIFYIGINIFTYLNETRNTSDKYLVEHPFKSILGIFLIICAVVLITFLLTAKVFSENVANMNIILCMLILVVEGIYICIKSFIQSDMIKKINNRIKEKSN